MYVNVIHNIIYQSSLDNKQINNSCISVALCLCLLASNLIAFTCVTSWNNHYNISFFLNSFPYLQTSTNATQQISVTMEAVQIPTETTYVTAYQDTPVPAAQSVSHNCWIKVKRSPIKSSCLDLCNIQTVLFKSNGASLSV